MSDTVVENEPAKKSKPAKSSGPKNKLKIQLNMEKDHPLTDFLNEVKERKAKDFDTADFIMKALETLPNKYWENELEELTPLEYKIEQALNDPHMREKLSEVLN